MSEATFGERLAEARRIKGETIEDVSEQLRIRPSIILAMETGNFSHMPHKGYTRNMVSSYARYLGLDSTHLTEQFLREFRRWESSGGRRASGVGSSNASTLSLASSRRKGESIDESYNSGYDDARETVTAAQRTGRSSVWNRDEARDVDREFRSHLRQAQDDQRPSPNESVRRVNPRRTPVNEPSRQVRGNDYVGKPPRKPAVSGMAAQLFSRPVLLIIGAVVLFLILLALWALLASTCSRNEATNIPAVGAGDTATGLEEEEVGTNLPNIEQQIVEDNRYGPFELLVEVEGGASWLLVTVDGEQVLNDTMSPPWSQSWMVTVDCNVSTGAPGNVKVFRNGIEVPMGTEDDPNAVALKVEERPIVSNAQNADSANSTR